MKKLIFALASISILSLPPLAVNAMEPSYDAPHITTCGASSYIIKNDNSLWFFGRDKEEYLTPVKVMDNVKKVMLGNMSTTYGAYMPTSLILTYNGDLYVGGEPRYCPFNISDEISLVRPEKIWDGVRDIGTPSGYGQYAFIDNNGDFRSFSMGEANEVVHTDHETVEEYYMAGDPDRHQRHLNWVTNLWWEIDDLAEEDIAAGFYMFVKKDGSVWTAVNSPADNNWYHGFILGNGQDVIESYNKAIYIEPLEIMPPGSCYKKISVYLNGTLLEFDTQPVIKDGRTLVPVRAIFEQMGYTVEWDQKEQIAYAVKDNGKITVKLNDPIIEYTHNGATNKYECDVVPQLIDDRILVPLRAIAESVGCSVDWDGEAYTVNISSEETLNF